MTVVSVGPTTHQLPRKRSAEARLSVRAFNQHHFVLLVLLQLPWKSLTSIIEYYYMWKTTDRYVQQVKLSPGGFI